MSTRPGSDCLVARADIGGISARIERLWIAGGPYLFHGRFMDDVGLQVSAPGILAKVYRGATGVAVPVWNTGTEPATFDVWIDMDAVGLAGPIRATTLDTGIRIPHETAARRVKVALTLPAHEVDVVVVEASESAAAR